MDEKFNKLKETLKPEKFTDEEFPIKSAENNPWVKDGLTIDDVEYERPAYGAFLKDSHSAEDILQRQTGRSFS